jgi:hypothetical protein
VSNIHKLPTACIRQNADDLADGLADRLAKACADSLLRSLPAKQGNLRLLVELAFLRGLRVGIHAAVAECSHDEE